MVRETCRVGEYMKCTCGKEMYLEPFYIHKMGMIIDVVDYWICSKCKRKIKVKDKDFTK